MLGLILFIIAYVLYFPLTLINLCLVRNKGYFRDSALTLDKLANREFRSLWNKTLITEKGYPFGNIEETISAVLGHNRESSCFCLDQKALFGCDIVEFIMKLTLIFTSIALVATIIIKRKNKINPK